MFAAPLPASGTVTWQTTASPAPYMRAEVRLPVPAGSPAGLPGPAAALTNPIRLGRK